MATIVVIWFLFIYRDGVDHIEMASKEACISAAYSINHDSGRLWARCVSNTGEAIRP